MAPIRSGILGTWLLLAAEGVHLKAPASDGAAKVQGRRPSIFCFMVAIPSERWYVRTQLQAQMLTGCDAYTVYTNVSADTYFDSEGVPANFGGRGKMYGGKPGSWYDVIRHMDVGHFNNTQVLLQVWDHMLRMKHFEAYDWVVKVDPDTIFSADRLRTLLSHRNYAAPSILGNWGGDCKQTVGAMLVVTPDAVKSFGEKLDVCKDKLGQIPNEDIFFAICLLSFTKTVTRPEPLLIERFEGCGNDTKGPCPLMNKWMVASHLKNNPYHFHSCVKTIMGAGPKPDFAAEAGCYDGCHYKFEKMLGTVDSFGGPQFGGVDHLDLLRYQNLRRAHDDTLDLLRLRETRHVYNATNATA